jgi:tRNA(Ile)-lysidine synthase
MTADAFGQCFSAFDFSAHDAVVVAVSGGSDSSGLLVLLSEHLAGSSHRPELVAVTIDHGLRPGAAQEAQGVARFCAKLGLRHVIKTWEGAKPTAGIQAAAREARYRLLIQASRDVGASLVVTGHTEDDQLETVAMRAARGEGPGLSGIARATLAFGDDGDMLWFARPLLAVGRQLIRNELEQRNFSWVDDPSNANPDFERVAVRQSLYGALPSRLEELRAAQKSWSCRRVDLDHRTARLLEKHGKQVMPGLLLLSEDLACDADVDAAVDVVRICTAHAGEASRMMPVETAREIIEQLAGPERFRFAVSGALIDRRRQGLFLLREKRAGRGQVQNSVRATNDETLPAVDAPLTLARHAATTDSFSLTRRRALYPWSLRVPLFDLNSAAALARIVAQPAFPRPPCSP